MNTDTVIPAWDKASGQAKERWNRLTDEDLKQIAGHVDMLVGKIIVRYGYSREDAQKQVEEFLGSRPA